MEKNKIDSSILIEMEEPKEDNDDSDIVAAFTAYLTNDGKVGFAKSVNLNNNEFNIDDIPLITIDRIIHELEYYVNLNRIMQDLHSFNEDKDKNE